jgi:hypothetical protein
MRHAGKPRKHNDAKAATVVDMYKNGEPIKEICEATGLARSTIYQMLKRHGLTARRTDTHDHDLVGFELQDIATEMEVEFNFLVLENEHLQKTLLDMGVYTGTASSKAVPQRTHTASSVGADKEGNS